MRSDGRDSHGRGSIVPAPSTSSGQALTKNARTGHPSIADILTNYGCPSFRGFRKLGTTDLALMFVRHRRTLPSCANCSAVLNRLHRYYGAGYSHFITTSCYRRLPLLGTPQSRNLFLEILESVRRRYRFVVVGYVVMPEHVHLLLSEP